MYYVPKIHPNQHSVITCDTEIYLFYYTWGWRNYLSSSNAPKRWAEGPWPTQNLLKKCWVSHCGLLLVWLCLLWCAGGELCRTPRLFAAAAGLHTSQQPVLQQPVLHMGLEPGLEKLLVHNQLLLLLLVLITVKYVYCLIFTQSEAWERIVEQIVIQHMSLIPVNFNLN